MTTTDRILTGPRASSLVLCERKAVYEALGTEREETDPRMERIFARGRRLGAMLAEEIAETLAEEGRAAELEREIPWPLGSPIGTGHADLFIPDEGHTIEIVSTAGADLPPYKPRQVAFYSLNDPASVAATVLSIDPSTNEERAYPIDVETFRADLDESVKRVLWGIRNDSVRHVRRARRSDGQETDEPSGFPCFDCPFRRTCWQDWEPAPVGVLPDPLHEVVGELGALEDKMSTARVTEVPFLEEQRNALRERLAGHMRPGANYRAPGFSKVRVSEVSGRRTFSLKAFEDAGHTLPAVAESFVKVGAGHLRWTITREEPGA